MGIIVWENGKESKMKTWTGKRGIKEDRKIFEEF